MNEATSKKGSKIPAELWDWFEAVYWWDWGNPDLLAALIKVEQIPTDFQSAVADIIRGARKRRRNYKKSKVSARIRFNLGRLSWELSHVRDEILSDKEEVSRMSEATISETDDFRFNTQKAIRDEIASMAKLTGVCNKTVGNIRRDFQSRIDHWPTV